MSIISDLNNNQIAQSNCGGLFDYAQYAPRHTLDLEYFLKNASEEVLVSMYKRIPDELRGRVNSARERERSAQEAYEQVLDK